MVVNTQREVDFEHCGKCDQRFQCWTASRPQPISIFGDTNIGLQRLQQYVKAQTITMDEVSYQICEANLMMRL